MSLQVLQDFRLCFRHLLRYCSGYCIFIYWTFSYIAGCGKLLLLYLFILLRYREIPDTIERRPFKTSFQVKMSENIGDFERELLQYSEMGPTLDDSAPVPLTIQRYQQIIKANNSASVFDTDYSLPDINDAEDNANELEENIDDVLYRNEQYVTRVTSGRGRGGRNIYHTSTEQVRPGFSSDELELIRDIRKVAPLGYGNEITENSVRAHQRAKQLEREAENLRRSASKTSTPKNQSKSGSFSETLKRRPLSSLNHQSSDANNAEGVLSPEPNSSRANSSEGEAAPSRDERLSVETSKPVPISTLLRRCREDHKRKQQQLEREMLENEAASLRKVQELLYEDRASFDKDEAASLHKVEELLNADHLENSPKKSERSNDSLSDISTSTSRSENLSWRRRTNSPPRYAWGSNSAGKQLNLKSMHDFPPL